MNAEAYGYFLSLLDEAERAITHDSLAERLPLSRYTVTVNKPKEEEPKASPAPRRTPQKGSLSPLALVRDCYLNCHSCHLWQLRLPDDHPGVGTSHPLIMFVVDKRERDGSYLDPASMAYLDSWIKALYLVKNREVHLTSIIKCPGGEFDIVQECIKIFEAQVDALSPKAIVFLGEAGSLIATGNPDISSQRARRFFYRKVPSFVTYSPQMVLQDPSLKRAVWDDLRLAGDAAGITDRRPAARKS